MAFVQLFGDDGEVTVPTSLHFFAGIGGQDRPARGLCGAWYLWMGAATAVQCDEDGSVYRAVRTSLGPWTLR